MSSLSSFVGREVELSMVGEVGQIVMFTVYNAGRLKGSFLMTEDEGQ